MRSIALHESFCPSGQRCRRSTSTRTTDGFSSFVRSLLPSSAQRRPKKQASRPLVRFSQVLASWRPTPTIRSTVRCKLLPALKVRRRTADAFQKPRSVLEQTARGRQSLALPRQQPANCQRRRDDRTRPWGSLNASRSQCRSGENETPASAPLVQRRSWSCQLSVRDSKSHVRPRRTERERFVHRIDESRPGYLSPRRGQATDVPQRPRIDVLLRLGFRLRGVQP